MFALLPFITFISTPLCMLIALSTHNFVLVVQLSDTSLASAVSHADWLVMRKRRPSVVLPAEGAGCLWLLQRHHPSLLDMTALWVRVTGWMCKMIGGLISWHFRPKNSNYGRLWRYAIFVILYLKKKSSTVEWSTDWSEGYSYLNYY